MTVVRFPTGTGQGGLSGPGSRRSRDRGWVGGLSSHFSVQADLMAHPSPELLSPTPLLLWLLPADTAFPVAHPLPRSPRTPLPLVILGTQGFTPRAPSCLSLYLVLMSQTHSPLFSPRVFISLFWRIF